MIMDDDRCDHTVPKPRTSDNARFDLALIPELKAELKGKHFNDLQCQSLEAQVTSQVLVASDKVHTSRKTDVVTIFEILTCGMLYMALINCL